MMPEFESNDTSKMYGKKNIEIAISALLAMCLFTVPNMVLAAVYECNFNPAASDVAAPKLVVVEIDKHGFNAKVIRIEIDDVETTPSKAEVKSFTK